MSRAGPHVALFDPHLGGHHGLYVAQLVRFWREQSLPGRLDLLVAPGFRELHRDVASLIDDSPTEDLRLVTCGDLPAAASGALELARLDRAAGRSLARLLDPLRPQHCVLLYLDQLLLSLALDLRFRFPLTLSGIYFRPSFHYRHLDSRPRSIAERWRDRRKRLQLSAGMRNRHLTTLLCLDPFVVPHLQGHRRVRAVHLPEPVAPPCGRESSLALRARLGVEPGRRLVALLGSLAARKGVVESLEAARRLPHDAQRRLCLLLAGSIPASDLRSVTEAAARLRAAGAVQLLVEDRFVDDAEFESMLAGADLVLAPYQRHIGSSGILVRAAAAGVPVVGSDYGLVGALIVRHRLGLAVDSTDPEAMARALECALRAPEELGFDAREAGRFAAENTAERFAATVFRAAGLLTDDAG